MLGPIRFFFKKLAHEYREYELRQAKLELAAAWEQHAEEIDKRDRNIDLLKRDLLLARNQIHELRGTA